MWRTPTNLGQAWGSVNGADDQPTAKVWFAAKKGLVGLPGKLRTLPGLAPAGPRWLCSRVASAAARAAMSQVLPLE